MISTIMQSFLFLGLIAHYTVTSYLKGRTIDDFVVGLGQKRKKKTQPLLAWGKKSSPGWQGKKNQHEFSARDPQRSLMFRS